MTGRAPTGLVLAVALIASCASSGTATSGGALATATSATFMHTGFSAGPAMFTGADGRLAEARRYEPFGEPIDASLPGGVPDMVARDLNSLNKRTEVATGWSDHGARWMVPAAGRWLTPDPPVVGPAARFMLEPWALHPYQYVDQNPVRYWDPDGREPEEREHFEVTRGVLDWAFEASRDPYRPERRAPGSLPRDLGVHLISSVVLIPTVVADTATEVVYGVEWGAERLADGAEALVDGVSGLLEDDPIPEQVSFAPPSSEQTTMRVSGVTHVVVGEGMLYGPELPPAPAPIQRAPRATPAPSSDRYSEWCFGPIGDVGSDPVRFDRGGH